MKFCRQVLPEYQDSYLFFQRKNSKGSYDLEFNDEYYTNHAVIHGNKEFAAITTNEFDRLIKFNDSNYQEFEEFFTKSYYYKTSFDNLTQALNYYFAKSNGKKYNTREVHKWKLLLKQYFDNYDLTSEFVCAALELMTGCKWREITMRGCMQREWQNAYVDDQVSEEMADHLELCYFNTGNEYIVYETKEDFENEENGYSIYVDSWNSKERLIQALGDKDIKVFDFDHYTREPIYKEL